MGKFIGVIVLVFLGLTALAWVSDGLGLLHYKFFAPKYEQVRRETYEQTKSYRQGSVQRLGTLCTQVAEAEDKRLLNGVIEHEFQEWDVSDVPGYLQPCLNNARAGN